jgi:hypothetical protein
MFVKERTTSQQSSLKRGRVRPLGLLVLIVYFATNAGFPPVVSATHEADHRFMVEGYVCGGDGKGVSNVDVLVKDTRISYGQVVRTDGNGYYKAMFHLHNDNLGDPLLVEVRGEQKNFTVEFDPKDLESERKLRVNFGAGCDVSGPPVWFWWGGGALVAVVGIILSVKLARSQQRYGRIKGKSQGKRKS